MEQTKRKYTKQKTGGKITVKHFLNTRLKGKPQADGHTAYPLYIRIMVKGQQSDIKSRLTGFIAPKNFDWFTREYKELLTQEIREITGIIEGLNPFDKQGFSLQTVTSLYSRSTTPITTVIEACLKDELRYCIVRNDPDTPEDTDLANPGALAVLIQENSTVGIVDWQKPAYTILTMLQDVLPRLSEPLRKLEKQYGAAFNFDSLYNTLYAVHRYPVKPTLNDWQTSRFKKDITNKRTVEVIDQLLKNHYRA